MSQLTEYRSKALTRIKEARQQTRVAVSAGEIVLGSFASGFVSEKMGEVAGVPADAAIGLVAIGVGIGMRQTDITALGVGFLAGYARDMGKSVASGASFFAAEAAV